MTTLTPIEVHRIRCETDKISSTIGTSGYVDSLTLKAKEWVESFRKALAESNWSRGVFDHYVTLLQDMLVDKKTQVPLAPQDAVLGADGCTYGIRSLEFYARNHKKKLQSAYGEASSSVQTLPEHVVANYLIDWLQEHDAALYSQEFQNAQVRYNHSITSDNEIRNSMKKWEAVSHRPSREQKRQMMREMNEKLLTQAKVVSQAMEQCLSSQQQIRQQLEDTDQTFAEDFARIRGRIDEMEEGVEKNLANLSLKVQQYLRKSVHFLSHQRESFASQMSSKALQINNSEEMTYEALKQQAKELAEQAKALAEENRQLGQNIDRTASQIELCNNACNALEKQVEDLEKAISESKKTSLGGIARAVLSVTSSIFATWAVNSFVLSSSIKIGLFPTKGGAGLQINYSP